MTGQDYLLNESNALRKVIIQKNKRINDLQLTINSLEEKIKKLESKKEHRNKVDPRTCSIPKPPERPCKIGEAVNEKN